MVKNAGFLVLALLMILLALTVLTSCSGQKLVVYDKDDCTTTDNQYVCVEKK